MRFQISLNGQTSILDPAQSFFGSDGLHYSNVVLTAFTDQQLAAIGVTKVADAPPAVPAQVLTIQGLVALKAAGKLDAVNAAVAGASADVQLWFANTPIFRRDNAMLLGVATGLGWSSADLDALFIAAAQVPV